MKTVIIYGQRHKGSTYHIAHDLADLIGGEVTEFFCRENSENSVLDVPTALSTQKENVHIINPWLQLYKRWMLLM